VREAESRLRKALEDKLKSLESETAVSRAFLAREIPRIIERLPQYNRQYFGTKPHRSRYMLINFFPASGVPERFPYWQKHMVSVNDGGSWYWRIRYDVERKAFSGPSIND
jgi:hypothetical protein